MNIFHAKNLHKRIAEFMKLEVAANLAARKSMSDDLQTGVADLFVKSIKKALPDLRASGMTDAVITLERLEKTTASTGGAFSAVQANAETARYAITNDMDKRTFLHVPIHLTDFVDNDALFGPEVQKAFPKAVPEIRAAGNCLAADCNTAAVFHLMRVSEYGLRSVARRVGVKLTDKGVSQPLEYADWTKVISETNRKIASLRSLSAGPKKAAQLTFYSDIVEQFDRIKDIWRNTVSHARQSYNAQEAMGVISRVRDLMIRIARGPG